MTKMTMTMIQVPVLRLRSTRSSWRVGRRGLTPGWTSGQVLAGVAVAVAPPRVEGEPRLRKVGALQVSYICLFDFCAFRQEKEIIGI